MRGEDRYVDGAAIGTLVGHETYSREVSSYLVLDDAIVYDVVRIDYSKFGTPSSSCPGYSDYGTRYVE